jgi:hypothetical protein
MPMIHQFQGGLQCLPLTCTVFMNQPAFAVLRLSFHFLSPGEVVRDVSQMYWMQISVCSSSPVDDGISEEQLL